MHFYCYSNDFMLYSSTHCIKHARVSLFIHINYIFTGDFIAMVLLFI